MSRAIVPRVSVIVPTYNFGDFLDATIESVLGQTFGDLELLVLDNASTDQTPDVVGRFADPRLCYVRNPENIGFAANVNQGFGLARGELLIVLGADDVWAPEFLRRAVTHFDTHPGVSFVHGMAVWIDERGEAFGDSGRGWAGVTPGPEAFVNFFRYGFSLSTMLMPTDAVRRLGGLDAPWGDIADGWLFLRLCLAGNVGYLDEPLVRYRVHQRTLSTAMSRRGNLFRRYLAMARAAFELPAARQAGLDRQRRLALRYAARSALSQIHTLRQGGGRREFLKSFGGVIWAAPELCAFPFTWARLGLGLLPAATIARLQAWRRRRWAAAARRVTATTPPGLAR